MQPDTVPTWPGPRQGTSVVGGVARRNAAFTLLASVQFVLILAMSVLNVVLPEIQEDLGLTTPQLALLNAAYGVSFSGLLLLGGRLADLYGARRAFMAGTALFGVTSAAAGLAPEVWTLLAARFGQGAGAALAVPGAMVLVGVVHPEPARRARVMALWGGLAAFGGTAGMLLSGAVALSNSWRWAFVVPVVVAALAVGSARKLLPVGRVEGGAGELDVPGAVLATASVSLLSYGLVQTPDRGWVSWAALVPLSLGVVLLIAFVLVEQRAPRPLLPLSFLRSPHRVVALVAVFLGSAGITSLFFLLSLYFQQVREYSAPEASAAFLPFGVALVIAGVGVGRLVHRFGPRVVMLAGLALAALGLGTFGGIGLRTPYTGVVVGLLLFAVGVGFLFAGATVSAMADVAPGQAGMAGAVVTTALEAGPALGLSMLVTLAAVRTGHMEGAGHSVPSALAAGYALAFTVAALAFAVVTVGAAALLRVKRH
ncbi:MFS transporter [Streptomyces sp. AM 4-1-1]|uniref:MFS transporter n=1 Tax=Streptomyces sp. AM 4-1-1 TaxID=3028710 RepID=UPI0023B88A0B|nr:MFS transporter [Streptomyces sp. AM 4-1-1]WEH36702.1 MFS transporter [Streptomyces sp. AM 4-1-1]